MRGGDLCILKRVAAKFVEGRHRAAVMFWQVPKKCTDLDFSSTFWYWERIESAFVREILKPALRSARFRFFRGKSGKIGHILVLGTYSKIAC